LEDAVYETMNNIKKLYWLFSVTLLIQVANLVIKAINIYYFNLIVIGILLIATAMLGRTARIKTGVIVTLLVLNLLLVVTMIFIPWN